MTKIEEAREEIQEIIEDFSSRFNEALNEIAKLVELKESKKGKWKPAREGEIYYCRTIMGVDMAFAYYDNQEHNYIIKNQPIFKTEEQCKRYWHFMDTVKEKSYEFSKEEFENHNIRKHIIYYDFERKCFDIDRSINIKYFGEIYFKTEEDCQYIIDNFKEELMEFWI